MKTTIYIVRHGQTRWNLLGEPNAGQRVPINTFGIKQAKKSAKHFKKIFLHCVYCSPALRTRQTAKIIAPKHKHLLEKNFNVRDMGNLDGTTIKQMLKIVPDVEKQWKKEGIDWIPPGTKESVRSYMDRSVDAFNKVAEKHKGETALIVTHAGVMRAIIHWIAGGKPEDFFSRKMPENAEVVKIVYDGKKFKIKEIK